MTWKGSKWHQDKCSAFPGAHLKTTGGCKSVHEELGEGELSSAQGKQTGMRLEVGRGSNEGSENRWSGCWKPAYRQDSLAPRSGPRGTAGELSQAGNIDVVIGIRVLHLGSRLVVEAHIFTADLYSWGMETGSFQHLGTTREASLDLGRVIVASTAGNGVGWGGSMYVVAVF